MRRALLILVTISMWSSSFTTISPDSALVTEKQNQGDHIDIQLTDDFSKHIIEKIM